MKVLHITYGYDGGGVGYVIYNYCARRPMDGIRFEIVGEFLGRYHLLQEDFEKAGFECSYVSPKGDGLLRNMLETVKVMLKHDVDAVHVHMEEWSFLYLMMARLCGIRVRLCHAHMANMTGADTKPHYKLFRFLLQKFSTDRLACSTDAGDHLFGKAPYTVLHNAIDTKRYVFDKEMREKKREGLGIADKFVIGAVGRLSYQKNPQMTLDIFREVCRKRQDAVLLFIGKGELEKEVRNKTELYGLSDKVFFLGHRKDVPELLQAMDVFLLPSRFEGLGIVYVEAQAAGLQTFGTKELVPVEAAIDNSLMHFVDKNAPASVWAERIVSCYYKNRPDITERLKTRGYDIDTESERLERIYKEAAARENI